MGQQQILFLILAICILGIAFTAGVIAHQADESVDLRNSILADLQQLAGQARMYRARPYEEYGGDGTFLGLTATPEGITKLTGNPRTPYAQYAIARSGNVSSVEIVGIGTVPGNDSRRPICMRVTVFAESTAIAVLN